VKFRGQRRSATNDENWCRFFAGECARSPSLFELAAIYDELRNLPNPPDILGNLFGYTAEVPELLDQVFPCRALDFINDVELAVIPKLDCSLVREAAVATDCSSAMLVRYSNELKQPDLGFISPTEGSGSNRLIFAVDAHGIVRVCAPERITPLCVDVRVRPRIDEDLFAPSPDNERQIVCVAVPGVAGAKRASVEKHSNVSSPHHHKPRIVERT